MSTSICLLFDQIRFEEKSILRAGERKGVKIVPVDAKRLYIDVVKRESNIKLGDVALQRCISYFRALHLSASLEHLGVLVINPFRVILTCGNKLFATLALLKAGVPIPEDTIAFTSESVIDFLERRGYDAVLKPVVGSWGRFVSPLKDRESVEAILELREFMHPLYQVYYIQERVRRPPRDIRATVIGDSLVAAIYRVAPPAKWKTTVARGGRGEVCKITPELEEIALKAAKAVGGGILGVDLMESPDGLLVHEVNHTIEFGATVAVTKVDIPGLIVDYAIAQVKR